MFEGSRHVSGILGVLALLAGLAVSGPATSQSSPDLSTAPAGSLRERLKARWQERHGAKPADAPAAGADIAPVTPITQPGDSVHTLVFGGLTRRYRVHVPTSYQPSQPTPLLLSFHGGGGNMDMQANDAYYGLIAKSEQAGYVAVFPNGTGTLPGGKMGTWNAGRCCAHARDENVDDVGFVRELLRRLSLQLNVDRARVFASGMSNGAMMSYRLACEMPEAFKAIAAVAGTDNTQSCTPKLPVSVLHIHAKDDELELFDGGSGRKSAQVTEFVSVPNSIAKWVALNGCAAPAKRVLETPGAYCELYSPCRDQTEIKLCATETGGHSWPGGTKPRGGKPGSSALSATDLMWDFFSSRR
jgi:polyhydroxybutyrate depolymerase